MIVVFASGGSQSNWCDSYDGKYLAESTFIKELLPYIDSHYRTIASRDGRSIQGMSMGGFGCMRLGLKYPNLFSSIVAFAGGFRRPEDVGAGGPSYVEMFNGDPEIFRKQHAWTIARENADNIRGHIAIQMYVGNKDPGIENNRHMHQVLEEMKIPHGYREFDGIAHNLKGMVAELKAENFAFAAKSFKQPSGAGSSK
jgi:endo-1,4-beta-xylanase